MKAIVRRLITPATVGVDWTGASWENIPPEMIGNYMGEKPEHFPKTEVKIAYEDAAICVMFRVKDGYVRATAAEHQDSVCGDSCVEFFFSPGPDTSRGYFNFDGNRRKRRYPADIGAKQEGTFKALIPLRPHQPVRSAC